MEQAERQKIAKMLLETVDMLNSELDHAFKAGLKVHLSPEHSWPEPKSPTRPSAFVFLELKVEDSEILVKNINPRYVKSPWYVCEHSFGQVIGWAAGTDPLKADVYEECSKCGTKRFYVYPKSES